METGDGVRVKAAIAAYPVGTTHPSSIMTDPHRSANARSSLAFDREERGVAPMDLNVTREMKIIQFPVKLDKFTGFFDKFLKTNGEDRN